MFDDLDYQYNDLYRHRGTTQGQKTRAKKIGTAIVILGTALMGISLSSWIMYSVGFKEVIIKRLENH